ncbi:MAG TPA: AEC family transporter, partial [Gammaproteobacteria bacterium]|nr:AEC family transporter [Gammaproteobacteria bacterium]
MLQHILMIAPLLIMVIIGFIAQRLYQLQSRTLSSLAIYTLTPAVVFLGITGEHISLSVLYIPPVVLVMGITICILCYYCAGFLWHDARHQMVGFASGTANSSYFGIPVCGAILGPEGMPVAVMYALGHTLFESTVGYYLAARGEGSVKQSLIKLVKLPVLYALVIAITLRVQNWAMPGVLLDTLELLESAFIPIGMMLIGVGLAESKLGGRPDVRFIGVVLFAKFFLWMVVTLAVIWLDTHYLHWFSPLVHQVLLLQAVAPVAVSTVAYSAQFKLFPEKMAMTVVLSLFMSVVMLWVVISVF